ncbi:uncharacterized protein PAC_06029 [Phialocephala subalpina]|uniref:Uncharacterized protein n=1 Tax=Phialocephala subalpina TaxID=576137 RepID=A0A1L7WTP6_9HELO|nr:uncharacterized protein PAC_06029 [Phialocephala subalpina]
MAFKHFSTLPSRSLSLPLPFETDPDFISMRYQSDKAPPPLLRIALINSTRMPWRARLLIKRPILPLTLDEIHAVRVFTRWQKDLNNTTPKDLMELIEEMEEENIADEEYMGRIDSNGQLVLVLRATYGMRK